MNDVILIKRISEPIISIANVTIGSIYYLVEERDTEYKVIGNKGRLIWTVSDYYKNIIHDE
jgi:hypothetical protein